MLRLGQDYPVSKYQSQDTNPGQTPGPMIFLKLRTRKEREKEDTG